MTRRSSVRAQARENYRDMVAEKAADPSSLRFDGQAPLPNPPPQRGREQAEVGAGQPSLTARVRALYEDSAVPVREIAAMAGVTERTIYKYARKHDWKPRYRWPHPRSPQGRPRHAGEAHAWRRDERRRAAFAPVKGAGGRFIRRADKGKPFAEGLKATDPAAAARAVADCDEAARLARAAEKQAEAEQRLEERMRAHAWVNRALDKLIDYREERAKEWAKQRAMQRPARPAPDDDPVEHALRLALALATDRWHALLAEEKRLRSVSGNDSRL